MPRKLVSLACLSVLGLAPIAHAQGVRLDPSTFIEALEREKMDDLIIHLARTGNLKPQEARQIEIAQQLQRAADAALDLADRRAAVARALELQRALIKDNYDDVNRPVWQTRLVAMLLLDQLNLDPGAAEFYELGFPGPEQRRAFEQIVPQALEQAADAFLRLFDLSTSLPQRPDYRQEYVDTGVAKRLFEDYFNLQTRYWDGLASYYAALLPADNPYYQSLGQNKLIGRQGGTPAEERRRLLDRAVERFTDLARQANGIDANLANSLAARAMIAAGDYDKALPLLDNVVAANKGDRNDYLARLARIRALDKTGQTAQAEAEAQTLRTHPLLVNSGDLSLRVLTADVMHRLLVDRGLPPAQTYAPYEKLINDPDLADDLRAGLEGFIYRRWAANIDLTKTDVAQLPAMVLKGIAKLSLLEGRNLLIEANELEATDAAAAKAKFDAGLPMVQRSIQLSEELLGRADLTESLRAEVTYDLGVAIYVSNPSSAATLFKATEQWVTLAQTLPAQPQSLRALADAVAVLRQIHAAKPRPAGAADRYEKAITLLLDPDKSFARTPAAENERTYYAMFVLMPRNDYAKAMDVLSGVQPTHPQYLDARREMLYCLERLAQSAPDKDAQTAGWTRLLQVAQDMARETGVEIEQGASGQRALQLRDAQGHARLLVAAAHLALGQPREALVPLENWEKDFAEADHAALRIEGMGKRISALVAADRIAEGVKAATQMMELAPAAAEPVVDQVLTDVDRDIEGLKRQMFGMVESAQRRELETRRATLASAARQLAQLLYDQGRKQNLNEEQMLPRVLMLAKSMRMSGDKAQMAEASKIIQPMLANPKFKNDAGVLNAVAESLFAVGDKPSFDQAKGLYTQIIRFLPTDPVTGKGPPLWWNAWMRYLQILDATGGASTDIVLSVRKLLKRDPALGGDPYATELKRLEVKHTATMR